MRAFASRRRLLVEPLEDRVVLSAGPVISELMASNTDTLMDEDGAYSDWVEIHNPTAAAVDLAGWHLTDARDDLTKWQFPAVRLDAGELLVVFASGKNRTDPAAPLHTDFKLNAGGEYLALVEPDGVTAAHEYAAAFPEQFPDVSYGVLATVGDELAHRYFTVPTPGATNQAGFAGFVAQPQASRARGFYTEPMLVDLSTETDGATVRYTLDGSEPTGTGGSVYSTPILISGTTTLRVTAFKPDYVPAAIETYTYIFLDDVIAQSPNGQTPPGWPARSINGQVFDYGMDGDIVNSPAYQDQIEAALQAIPTLSIVTDLDNLFDPATGIYVNARRDGFAWERPTSVELLNGQYWGLYQTQERSEASYAEDYFGGNAQDYDVIKAGSARLAVTDGSLDKWQALWAIANTGFATDERYYAVQGKDPDGTDNPALEVHVDIDNLIDYMAVIFFTGNRDAPTSLGGSNPNNFWGIRNRDPAARAGWRFFAYDSEHSMLAVGDNITTTTSAGQQVQDFNPQWLHQKLMQHSDYRQRFGDRVNTHFFGNGVMTPQQAQTLVKIDADGPTDDPANWQSSNEYGGSPGETGTGPVVDVIVNEVLSHSDGEAQDRIELYNTTAAAVELSGWYLSDDTGNLLKSTLASPTTIDARDYLTLGQEDAGIALDGRFGDEIWLIAADPVTGRPQRFADHVEFDAAQTNVSLGRWPDGAATSLLFPMNQQTFGAANDGPAVSEVIVSELNYHPAAPPPESGISEGELEFVEIYNRSGTALVLDDWQVGGFGFSIPPGTTLAPDGVLVVVPFDPTLELAKATQFRTIYGVDQTAALLGPAAGALQNGGETIKLLRPENPGGVTGYLVVDQVRYDDTLPWPEEADGVGKSLTRIAADVFGSLPQSWSAAAATPGFVEFVPPGDVTGDGQVDGLDVDPFVSLLLGGQYQSAADMNSDGVVNGLDVDPFVTAVVGGGLAVSAAPELASSHSTTDQSQRRTPLSIVTLDGWQLRGFSLREKALVRGANVVVRSANSTELTPTSA